MDQRRAQETLARLLRAAATGTPSLAVIEGPPGSGKSTLVRAFLRERLMAASWQLAGARWEQEHQGSVLAPLLGEIAGERLGPALLDALVRDRSGPRVLVVDNLQWVDRSSFQALLHAWRRLGGQPTLVILVVSDQEIPALPEGARELLEDPAATRILLDAPDGQELSELVQRRLGAELNASAATQLIRYAQGNLHVMLQLVRENPAEQWGLFRRFLPAPNLVRQRTAAQLEGMAPRAVRILQAAAVLGADAALDKVLSLAGEDCPLQCLEDLDLQGLARIAGHGGAVGVEFDSEQRRMAIYQLIALPRRLALHRAAAQCLQDPDRALAHRMDAALLPDAHLAAELQQRAGALGQLGEWSKAASALHQAAQLSSDAKDREALLLRAVDATVAAGDLPTAMTFRHQLAALAASPERDVLTGYIAVLQGQAQIAERSLTEAWQLALNADSESALAAIAQRRVLHSLGELNGLKMLDWAEQALELAAPGSPLSIESSAIQGLGLAMLGRAEEGEALLKRMLETLPTGAQRQRAQMSLGWVYLSTDRTELARHELQAASSTDFSEGSHRIALWARGWLARSEFLAGDWDKALQTVRGAADLQQRSGIELLRPLIHMTAVQIHALRGNPELAAEHLARTWAPSGSYPVMELPYRLARAEAARAAANYDEVILALEPLRQLERDAGIDTPGFWGWQDLYADALIRRERVGEAWDLIAPLLQAAMEAGHGSATARYLAVRAMVHTAEGKQEAAGADFEQALAALRSVGAPYDRARIDFAYGQFLRRAGKRADCVGPLSRALAVFTHLDAKVYIERCQRELQASGIGLPRREPEDFCSLTAQEQAVARLVCEGATNKRAAAELFIGEKTVQYHLTKIYAKLGVSSRTELAAAFRRDTE